MGINEDLKKLALQNAKLEARKELEKQILDLKKQQADTTHETFEIEVEMEKKKSCCIKKRSKSPTETSREISTRDRVSKGRRHIESRRPN